MSSSNFHVNMEQLSSDPEVKKAAARFRKDMNDARNLADDKASEARDNFIERLMIIGEEKESHIRDTIIDLLSPTPNNVGKQNEIELFLRELSEQTQRSPQLDTLLACRRNSSFPNPEADERVTDENGEFGFEMDLTEPQSASGGHIESNVTEPEDESKQSTSQQNNTTNEDIIPETPMKADSEPVRAGNMAKDDLPSESESESESEENDAEHGSALHAEEDDRDEDQIVSAEPGSPDSGIATSSEVDDREAAAQEDTPNSTPERAGTDLETEKTYTDQSEHERPEDEEFDEGYDRPRECIAPGAGIPIQRRAEENEEEAEASSSNGQLPKGGSIFGGGIGYGVKRRAEDYAEAANGKKVKFMHQAEEEFDHVNAPYEDAEEDLMIEDNYDNLDLDDASDDEPELNSMAAINANQTVVLVEYQRNAKQDYKDRLKEGFYELHCKWCPGGGALGENINPTKWLMSHILNKHRERKPKKYNAIELLINHGTRIEDATLDWFQNRTAARNESTREVKTLRMEVTTMI